MAIFFLVIPLAAPVNNAELPVHQARHRRAMPIPYVRSPKRMTSTPARKRAPPSPTPCPTAYKQTLTKLFTSAAWKMRRPSLPLHPLSGREAAPPDGRARKKYCATLGGLRKKPQLRRRFPPEDMQAPGARPRDPRRKHIELLNATCKP